MGSLSKDQALHYLWNAKKLVYEVEENMPESYNSNWLDKNLNDLHQIELLIHKVYYRLTKDKPNDKKTNAGHEGDSK